MGDDGTSIEANTGAVAVASDPLECRACGYDIRGLDAASLCPECGSSVALALDGDSLFKADATWLRQLSRGLWLDAAVSTIAFLLQFPAFVDLLYGPPTPTGDFGVRGWIIFIGVIAMRFAGDWLITMREPRVWREPLGASLRLAVRYGVVVYALLEFAPLVSSAAIAMPLGFVTMTLSVMLVATWWVYVRRLQLRIPSEGLALLSRLTLIGLLAVSVVRHWLPWPLMWMGWTDVGAEIWESSTVKYGDYAFTLLAISLAAVTARTLQNIAGQSAGQNPEGGSISHDTDSSVAG